ncbi:MAG: hypothetical protein LBN05_06805 [Oscillospiraceae bacterium]|nr:hypothetical protein [Oscillospiraceae bacterium]
MEKLRKIFVPIVTLALLLTLALYALGVFTDAPMQVSGHADPAGGEYSGEMRKGKYQGEGALLLPNGDRYEGIFDDNIYSLRGRYTSVQNWEYSGELLDGKPNGRGTFTTKDGDAYEGEWLLGDISGAGEFRAKKGWRFVGTFQNGEFVEGKLTLKNGSYYEGKFVDGKPEDTEGLYIQMDDKGAMRWNYTGGFKAGLFEGKGLMVESGGEAADTRTHGTWTAGVLTKKD